MNSGKVDFAKSQTYPMENSMGNDSMAFVERLKKQGGGDFLRSLVESVLTDLMECEVTNQIGPDR